MDADIASVKKGSVIKSGAVGETQSCLQCGFEIGNIAGSKDAICKNCGWKDPCCE